MVIRVETNGDAPAVLACDHTAVIVVHGVGAAEAGHAIAALADSMKVKGLVLEPHYEVVRIEEDIAADGKTGRKAYFPVFLQEAHVADSGKVTFAELYWADLTKIGTGRIKSLLSLFQVIIEAHYIIDAMFTRRGVVQRALQFMLLWLSWVMRGPAVGVTVCSAGILGAGLYMRPNGIFAILTASPPLQCAVVLVGLFVAALALRTWVVPANVSTWRNSLNWVAIAAVLELVGLAVVVWFPNETHNFLSPYWVLPGVERTSELSWLVRAAYEVTAELWRYWSAFWLICLVMLLLVGLAAIVVRSYRRVFVQALVTTGILSLQFLLWTAIVGTVVLPLITRASEVVGITELKKIVVEPHSGDRAASSAGKPSKIEGQERKVDLPSDFTRSINSREVKDLLDVSAFDKYDHEWIDRFVRAYGLNNIVAVFFILGGVFVFKRRREISEAEMISSSDLSDAAQRVPRLLFSGPLIAFLLVLTLLHAGMIIVGAVEVHPVFQRYVATLQKNIDWLEPAMRWVRQLGNEYWRGLLGAPVFTIGIASAALLPFLVGRSLNDAVHIARDLIDHQSGPQEGRTWKFGMSRETDRAKRWPSRARIASRLLAVLDEVLEKRACTRIVLVGHSQGTVVVYDYLKTFVEDGTALPVQISGVISMGSPLTNIYARYYHEYEDVGNTLGELKAKGGRWINIYRIDDYVGQWIDKPNSTLIENRPLNPNGHMGYWSEDELASALKEMLSPPAKNDELQVPVG